MKNKLLIYAEDNGEKHTTRTHIANIAWREKPHMQRHFIFDKLQFNFRLFIFGKVYILCTLNFRHIYSLSNLWHCKHTHTVRTRLDKCLSSYKPHLVCRIMKIYLSNLYVFFLLWNAETYCQRAEITFSPKNSRSKYSR